MKTEVKMIAAIIAVFAVAFAGVYVSDSVAAADEDDGYTNQPIWPNPSQGQDDERQYADFKYKGATETTPANWVEDSVTGTIYWYDTYQSADRAGWLTILDGTATEINGNYETFRIRAQGPATADIEDFKVTDLEIDIFNFRDGYTVVNTVIQPEPGYDIDLSGPSIDMDDGTIYLDALYVRIQGNVYNIVDGNAQTIPASSYYKVITVPLIVKKANVSTTFEYVYVYNGLEQTPLERIGGDNSDASTPYVHYEFGHPEGPQGYLAEDDLEAAKSGFDIEWLIDEDSIVSAINTNKYEAMLLLAQCEKNEDGQYIDDKGNVITYRDLLEPYTITLTPSDDKLVAGSILVKWWIVPLGLDDIDFDVRDVYYDFDNEVKPTVENHGIAMTWYEPEDGPNGARAHYVPANRVNVAYIMPDDYPYDMPVIKVPVYKQDGTKTEPLKDAAGNIVYNFKIADADSEYRLTLMVDGQEVEVEAEPVLDSFGNIVYEDIAYDETDEFEQALDIDGNPLFRYLRYSDGSVAYFQMVDADGKLVFEKKVDADGNLVDDLNKPIYDESRPIMLPVMVKKYLVDEENSTPKLTPVYDMDSPIMVPVLTDEPVEEQAVALDQNGNELYMAVEADPDDPDAGADTEYAPVLIFEDVAYTEKKYYEDGQLADATITGTFVDKNGKAVADPDKSTVYRQYTKNGIPQYNKDGTPIWDTSKPVMVQKFVQAFIKNAENGEYSEAVDEEGLPITVPVYDTESNPVMVQKYDEVTADFTSTQVGHPYDGYDGQFNYGVHITSDTGFYEFDTNDYKQAVNEEGDPVFAPLFDDQGNLVIEVIGVDPDTQEEIVKVDKDKPLYEYGYAVIEEETKAYVVYDGVLYDENKFIWHILPLPLEREWVEFKIDGFEVDVKSVVVPAGYTHKIVAGYNGPNNTTEPLAEDYEILKYDVTRDCHTTANGNKTSVYAPWPFDGQYKIAYERYGSGVETVPAGNFYGDAICINLNAFLLSPNVDTITVAGTLDADDLDELKRAVHFFPMDVYPQLQSFVTDDFLITVVNGDGEVVVFQDEIVRNILASDWYSITVTGKLENGYYGTLFGYCFIDRVALEFEASDFEYEDYTTAGIAGVKITGYNGSDKNVVIPDFIDGKKVLAIGDKAFYGNKDITSVTFGKYVRTVGLKAFAACSNLKSVEFDDDLQVISSYAFFGDKALTKVIFGNGLRAVRENAFSVPFISGIATEDMAGKELYRAAPKSNGPSFIPVPAYYVDEDGKTQFYASALAGKAFLYDEDAGALFGIPMDFFYEENLPMLKGI